jgi:hypothetical protein
MLDTGYWMLDAGYWILGAGYWMLGKTAGLTAHGRRSKIEIKGKGSKADG